MQTKAADALYDYWTQRRGTRAVPLRSDIEPAHLAAILPDLFILEHNGATHPGFRLAGTRLCAQFGRELKGTCFDALFAAEQRNRIARIAENVMAHRAPTVLAAEMIDATLDTTLVEIVLLPLATTGRTADRIIGAFAPLPGQPRPLSAFRYGTLAAVTAIDGRRAEGLPDVRAGATLPTSVMAMRPSAMGEAASRVLHLRVFDGGRRREDGPER